MILLLFVSPAGQRSQVLTGHFSSLFLIFSSLFYGNKTRVLQQQKKLTCNSGLFSKSRPDGRPSSVVKTTWPPVRGEISEYSDVQVACVSFSRVNIARSGVEYECPQSYA